MAVTVSGLFSRPSRDILWFHGSSAAREDRQLSRDLSRPKVYHNGFHSNRPAVGKVGLDPKNLPFLPVRDADKPPFILNYQPMYTLCQMKPFY